ncbi:phasin family protein [Rhizobium binae]|uniref:phasin family protein n=2 Tax=Rhizobium binae TaxID=1138190 RepID=UPI001C83425A|nr:phasin family protein [Rhizobium binae]MBX4927874.1 phasin family protein [Rhizobium binae]MBX4938467.1 phasin family protein [Rhizobium binae]MBX4968368.1 phasin family protein [Rhizobium binae]
MFNDGFMMPEQALPATARNLFLASYRLNVEMSKAALHGQIELLNFFKHRLELYERLVDDLVASVELNDTFEVMADFTHNALAEGARESARLAMITSKMGSVSAKVARELADETVRGLAARTCA